MDELTTDQHAKGRDEIKSIPFLLLAFPLLPYDNGIMLKY